MVGFPGVQALDLVGPFEVFTSASLAVAGNGKAGYQPQLVSIDGQPVSTETGLTFAAAGLPDPDEPVDTLVLPGGRGTGADRRDPRLVDWIVAAAPNANRSAPSRTLSSQNPVTRTALPSWRGAPR